MSNIPGTSRTSYFPFSLAVGGIYTVLRSKAESSVDEMGDNYCMVGLCNERFVATEVEKMEPKSVPLKRTVDAMRNRNVGVSFLYTVYIFSFFNKVF